MPFPHFCRFFNSSWVLAQNNAKFIFIEVFCFIWHPTHPWIWLNSVWKELKTFLAVWWRDRRETWNSYLDESLKGPPTSCSILTLRLTYFAPQTILINPIISTFRLLKTHYQMNFSQRLLFIVQKALFLLITKYISLFSFLIL